MVLEAEIPKFTAWIGPALLWYLFAGSLLAVIVAATPYGPKDCGTPALTRRLS